MNKYFLSVILLLHCLNTLAQSDTLKIGSIAQNTHPFRARQLVIPASLLATSIAIRHIKINEKTFDTYTKEKVLMHFGTKTKIDDYLQYTPIIGTFALSNLGIKATHSLKERLIVGATAHAIMGILVNTLKYTTRIERPDHSATNSFPSGHTAFAFTGAEMLWQEYKNENIWIGISGYTIATTVGVLRVYNNRHWVSDVLAGASIGILSSKIAYGLLPFTNKLLKGKSSQENPTNVMIAYPIYSSEIKGLGLSIVF